MKKLKGKIESYLRNGQNNFEAKIDRVFCSLNFLKLKTTFSLSLIF